jgi:serine/threonine-protein kinase RsbW
MAMGAHLAAVVLDDGTTIRLLGADEGEILGTAIRAAYGDTYDAAWVYDAREVGRRIADGVLVSSVAEAPDGSLLCHAALSRSSPEAKVGEAGQAVTMPAARGHHLFTSVKRHLADWASANGLFGMFSEATTAHPYSERANVDLGAHEAGFLLGWIPATVANDASTSATAGRASAALFYLKTNDGHRRPVYSPDRHRDVIEQIIEICGLRGQIAEAPVHLELRAHCSTHLDIRADHNLAILTVESPGADLDDVVASTRRRLFDDGLDGFYVDLPLDQPESEAAGELLETLGVSFAGVFPNTRVRGDVLRMQSLNQVTVSVDDIATASDHGRQLLDYVLADLDRTT